MQYLRRWRPPPIKTGAALAEFLDQRAAFVAQKSVFGYSYLKTRLPMQELMRDKPFADAFEVARWEAFAAVLADMVVIAEGMLRAPAGSRAPALVDRLTELYSGVLGAHALPAHRAQGWSAEIAALRERLARIQLAPPLSAAAIGASSAERVYETLPIHESLRARDKPGLLANVQFAIVGLYQEFDRRIDRMALVGDLLPPIGNEG